MLTSADGPDAVSYQLSQVGNDQGGKCPAVLQREVTSLTPIAQKFLSALDDDPTIGKLIDQTMDFEYEQQQMMTKTGQK